MTILETIRNLEPTNQSIYRDIMALQLRLGDNDAAAATLRLLENQLADIEESSRRRHPRARPQHSSSTRHPPRLSGEYSRPAR